LPKANGKTLKAGLVKSSSSKAKSKKVIPFIISYTDPGEPKGVIVNVGRQIALIFML